MPQLVLNEEAQSLENVPEYWGELLKRLEQDADGRGEVVTAVRFDGVDEPTFHQPARSDRKLRDVTLIEVETATPHGLLDDALTQGAAAAGRLAAAAGQIASAFRRTDVSGANHRIAELCEGIRSLIALLGLIATARGASLDHMEWNGRAMSVQLYEVVGQLESVVEAQQCQDWLTVADILEYDFQPALQAWQPAFEALRAPISEHS